MKNKKTVLSSLLLLISIGGSLAFKAIAPGDVYYLYEWSNFSLQCSLTPPTPCNFAATTGTSGRYFTQPTPGTYVQLANNTALFTIK